MTRVDASSGVVSSRVTMRDVGLVCVLGLHCRSCSIRRPEHWQNLAEANGMYGCCLHRAYALDKDERAVSTLAFTTFADLPPKHAICCTV